MKVIEVENFSVSYNGKKVVNDISFSIEQGCIVGFIGPNGAGKSTTITNIVGLQNNYSGTIKVFGKDIKKSPMYKKQIGYVPEEGEVYELLTASEYLDFVGKLYSVDESTIKKRTVAIANAFSLDEKLHIRLAEYSKGMKQKVIIMSALIHNPDILLLDEPLDGLDAQSIEIVKALLQELCKLGKTIVYSSHIMEIVEEVSDKLIIIHEGNIVEQGDTKEITHKNDSSLSAVFQKVTGTCNPVQEAQKIIATLQD